MQAMKQHFEQAAAGKRKLAAIGETRQGQSANRTRCTHCTAILLAAVCSDHWLLKPVAAEQRTAANNAALGQHSSV